MKQIENLVIVPKNNHKEYTCWFFSVDDLELAKEVLKEQFPNDTHEIIKVDAEEFESVQEIDNWCFRHSWE